MFANVERERERDRERDWWRDFKVQSKHCIGGSTRRERERERGGVCVCVCVCVCVLFEISSVCFFTLGTRLRISKFCVDLCKENLIIRDV